MLSFFNLTILTLLLFISLTFFASLLLLIALLFMHKSVYILLMWLPSGPSS